MKAKIIEGKTLKQWKDKYGDKKDLQIVSAAEAKKDDGKILENKKWWLINGKYYQVPQKKWLIPLLCGLGAGAIIAGTITPIILYTKGCSTKLPYTKLKLTVNFDTAKVTIGGIIKTTDIKVDGCKDDGTVEKENLVWNQDYTVWMNDTEVADFGTNGYKFTTAANNKLQIKSKINASIIADSKEFTVSYSNATIDPDVTTAEISQQLSSDHPYEIKIKGGGATPTEYVNGIESVTKGGRELTSPTDYTFTISPDNPATITLTDAGLAYLGDIVVKPTLETIITITIPENLTISIGQNWKLKATIAGTSETPIWSSTDTSKATVDDEGYVTAVSATNGTVDVVATLPTSGKTATCKVTVQTEALKNYLTLKNESDNISKLTWIKGTTGTSLDYSTDGGVTWRDSPTTAFSDFQIAGGATLLLKGNLVTTSANTSHILITGGSVTLSGNLMNLLQDGDGNPATSINAKAFQDLFRNSSVYSTGLKKLDQTNERLLPVKDLSDKTYCYSGMFYGSSLESVPKNLLPATTLANYCYKGMFQGCASLSDMPKLPATNLPQYCYQSMFQGCEKLEEIPENYTIGGSGGTVGTYACYQMFYGTGLNGNSAVPSRLLPATTLASNCYNMMFAECEHITSLPENLILATTLAESCCKQMFQGCIGIITLPNQLMSATTLAVSCYSNMFEGCKGITNIPSTFLPAGKEGIGTLAKSCYNSMFKNCTGLIGDNAIPSGLLPATKLAEYCYSSMFEGCTKLEKAPSDLLQVTDLSDAAQCYASMFKDCVNLTNIPKLPANNLSSYCYGSMFYGCTTLTQLPEDLLVNVTTIKSTDINCCKSMFEGCVTLQISQGDPGKTTQGKIFICPEDTTTYTNAFTDMFKNCVLSTTEGTWTSGTPSKDKTYYWYTGA